MTAAKKTPIKQAPKAKRKPATKRQPRAKVSKSGPVNSASVVATVLKTPIKQDLNVIWEAMPGAQALAVSCPCNHILLEGARGGGKTDAQLMLFRKTVGMGYGTHWRGVLFDREYKNLADMIAKSKRWFRGLGDGARFLEGNSQLKWKWPTGEELLFRTLKTEDDYYNYHGSEFAYMGYNELTKNPNLDMYDMAMSLNRSSFVPELHSPDKKHPLPEIPLMVVSTTNPYGPGHNAVKQRFIDVAPPGVVVETSAEVFNPRTQRREVVTKTQVRIFSSYKENRYLAPEYVLELENIKDKNKRAAWLYGDWDITSGGMFDDVWSSQYNVVPVFEVPQSWSIYRTFDWGSSKPFSVGWWAESNGDDLVLSDGSTRSTINGDLFRMQEWYGWTGKDNTGLRMLNNQIARGIIEREIKYGWGQTRRITPGPADNSINDLVNGSSVANDMAASIVINGKRRPGPVFSLSNKSPGSRIQGWEKMRTAIFNAQPDEVNGGRDSPGLFVTNACADGFLRTVPTIPRSTKQLDDVDTDAEDHCFAGGTRVLMPDGSTPMLAMLIGTTGHIMTDHGPREYSNARCTKRDAQTVEVTFSDGSMVRCTPDHRFMLANGNWCEAQYLYDRCLWNCRLRCLSVIRADREDVYCMTVPTLGRFSLAGGAIVANCADESRYMILSTGSRFGSGTTLGTNR